jgi:hypothetical protein
MAKLTFVWRMTKWVSQNRRFVIIQSLRDENSFYVVDLDSYDDKQCTSFKEATEWAEERAGAACLSS